MRIKITTINENSEYERCKARHGERLAKIICRIARRYKTVRIETDDIEYVSHKPDDDTKEYFHIIYHGNIIYVNKEMNLSVGVTGTFKPRIFDRVEFIEKRILPVVE